MSEPDTTALVFIECQRGVVGDLSVLPALAESARAGSRRHGPPRLRGPSAGVQVVHLTYLTAGGREIGQPALPTHASHRVELGLGRITPRHGDRPRDRGRPDELVLPRHQGISPVHRTEILAVLRNMGITEVVVAGVSTNLAIPLAAVGAADEDFAVTIPTDGCVGTPPEHHASMLRHSLAFVARLATVDELLGEWSA